MEQTEREILKLLAEGKVDVSEAERLLSALKQGGRHNPLRPESRLRRDLNQALASVQESLVGLGPQLKRAFGSGEGADDLDIDIDFKLDDEPLGEPVELESGALALPEGCELRIEHQPEKLRGGADLELIPSPDDLLRVHGEGTERLRAYKGSRGLAIRWRSGPLQVEVPGIVAETRTRLVGGDLLARELPGALSAKLAGGDAEILAPGGDFRVQTAGGSLRIELGSGWAGSGRVSSAGGEVSARIDRGLPGGRIEARAIGGEIRLIGEFANLEPESMAAGQRLLIDFGTGGLKARLKFKTLGGDLVLERS